MRPGSQAPFDDMHEDRNGHMHTDSGCFQCLDCSHWKCQHQPDPTAVDGHGQCDVPYCNCLEAVAVDGERTRCAFCGGYGERAVEPIPLDPQQLELRTCWVCGGSGDAQTAVAS
jgi:hypothetical protein